MTLFGGQTFSQFLGSFFPKWPKPVESPLQRGSGKTPFFGQKTRFLRCFFAVFSHIGPKFCSKKRCFFAVFLLKNGVFWTFLVSIFCDRKAVKTILRFWLAYFCPKNDPKNGQKRVIFRSFLSDFHKKLGKKWSFFAKNRCPDGIIFWPFFGCFFASFFLGHFFDLFFALFWTNLGSICPKLTPKLTSFLVNSWPKMDQF